MLGNSVRKVAWRMGRGLEEVVMGWETSGNSRICMYRRHLGWQSIAILLQFLLVLVRLHVNFGCPRVGKGGEVMGDTRLRETSLSPFKVAPLNQTSLLLLPSARPTLWVKSLNACKYL